MKDKTIEIIKELELNELNKLIKKRGRIIIESDDNNLIMKRIYWPSDDTPSDQYMCTTKTILKIDGRSAEVFGYENNVTTITEFYLSDCLEKYKKILILLNKEVSKKYFDYY